MTFKRLNLLAGSQIPDLHCFIPAGRSDVSSIWTEFTIFNGGSMTDQGHQLLSAVDIPDLQGLILA